jgi:hypothetical protein
MLPDNCHYPWWFVLVLLPSSLRAAGAAARKTGAAGWMDEDGVNLLLKLSSAYAFLSISLPSLVPFPILFTCSGLYLLFAMFLYL